MLLRATFFVLMATDFSTIIQWRWPFQGGLSGACKIANINSHLKQKAKCNVKAIQWPESSQIFSKPVKIQISFNLSSWFYDFWNLEIVKSLIWPIFKGKNVRTLKRLFDLVWWNLTSQNWPLGNAKLQSEDVGHDLNHGLVALIFKQTIWPCFFMFSPFEVMGSSALHCMWVAILVSSLRMNILDKFLNSSASYGQNSGRLKTILIFFFTRFSFW